MTVEPAPSAPGEAAIRAAFARERLRPHAWSSAPGERFEEHAHTYHKVLYCVRGSITFRMAVTGERIALVPGERLDIEPQARHSAVAGADGVTCIEAARERSDHVPEYQDAARG